MTIIARGVVLLAGVGLTAQPPTPEAGYTDHFIVSEGRRVHCLDWGSAEKTPFIMLHGIGRSAHSYDDIAPHFQGEYHVIAMDLRGHGDSTGTRRQRSSSKTTSKTSNAWSSSSTSAASSKRRLAI